MDEQGERPDDDPDAASDAASVSGAGPIVTVPVRRQAWDDEGTLDLPAGAASHWDQSAWRPC